METYRHLKRNVLNLILCLFAILLVAGCAKTKVISRNQAAFEQLPRPATIYVQDFAGSSADLPADSTMAREFVVDASAQTPEQIALGRQLGATLAAKLVEQIREMGLPAQQAFPDTKPAINDIFIRGCLVSIDKGSTAKRVAIGFGSGGSELLTVVEVFQVTPSGLRKLGSGSLQSGSAKTPGTAVGAATFIATANPAGLIVSGGMKVYGEASGSSKVEGRAKATAKEIADVLEKRFQQQGWIN